jgi:hypothetical protein
MVGQLAVDVDGKMDRMLEILAYKLRGSGASTFFLP